LQEEMKNRPAKANMQTGAKLMFDKTFVTT
jgi:hypothetical protein